MKFIVATVPEWPHRNLLDNVPSTKHASPILATAHESLLHCLSTPADTPQRTASLTKLLPAWSISPKGKGVR
jgi:hypothetical protein